MVWNGSSTINFNDLNANASLNLDLEQDGDGDDSIGITINFSDQAATDGLSLTLWDGSTTHTVDLDIPVVATGNPETLYFEFAEYETAGVNINSVEYIALGITGPTASDLELDFLETAVKPIPFEFSPGLGLLISGGFFSFLIIRSRKANKSKQA